MLSTLSDTIPSQKGSERYLSLIFKEGFDYYYRNKIFLPLKSGKNEIRKETEIFGKSMKARFVHGYMYTGTLQLEVNLYLIKEIENIHSGSQHKF